MTLAAAMPVVTGRRNSIAVHRLTVVQLCFNCILKNCHASTHKRSPLPANSSTTPANPLGDQVRLEAFADYLNFTRVDKILDIGCGPGYISAKIPVFIDYIGLDSDEQYIRFANARFGAPKRHFYSRLFDQTGVANFGNPDLNMLNCLLHHLDNDSARTLLLNAYYPLEPSGIVFRLDGCFVERQNPIDRYLLKNDRGTFVRTELGYRALAPSAFGKLNVRIRDGISRISYTFIITLLQKSQ
jgi:SAM-dependent methyltransferase